MRTLAEWAADHHDEIQNDWSDDEVFNYWYMSLTDEERLEVIAAAEAGWDWIRYVCTGKMTGGLHG